MTVTSTTHRSLDRRRTAVPSAAAWRRRALAGVLLAALSVLGLAPPAAAAAPTITSISPRSGELGTQVTIDGSGFAPTVEGNTVTFGTVPAQVVSATATRLVVVAPPPRVSSKVRVRTAEGVSASADFFMLPRRQAPGERVVGFTGRMRIDGPPMTFTFPTGSAPEYGLVMFDAQRGQRVYVEVSGVTTGRAVLRMLKPDETSWRFIVASAGSAPKFIDSTTLGVTGSWNFVVQGDGPGKVTLAVRSVPADSTGTLTRGQPQTVATAAPFQNALRSFTAVAGQRIAVGYTGVTYPDVRMIVLRPDGTALGAERFATPSSPTGVLDTVTIPTSGTYRVKVDPVAKAIGQVSLTLRDVP